MPFKLTKTANQDFEPCPEGLHTARCMWVIDLGWHETPFGVKPQVYLSFELDTPREDGNNFNLGKFYTASLHKKAILNHHLSGWRGKAIKDDEEIDLDKLVGLYCTLQVMHNDNEKPVISAIMPTKERFETAGELINSEGPFDNLPDWLDEIIGNQIEPPAKTAAKAPTTTQPEPVELNDEVPF